MDLLKDNPNNLKGQTAGTPEVIDRALILANEVYEELASMSYDFYQRNKDKRAWLLANAPNMVDEARAWILFDLRDPKIPASHKEYLVDQYIKDKALPKNGVSVVKREKGYINLGGIKPSSER